MRENGGRDLTGMLREQMRESKRSVVEGQKMMIGKTQSMQGAKSEALLKKIAGDEGRTEYGPYRSLWRFDPARQEGGLGPIAAGRRDAQS